MKVGELCESCGRFNEGRYHVVECSICEKDMCNCCGNLQACPQCFGHYDHDNYDTDNIIIDGKTYRYIIEKGEEIGEWQLKESKTT